MARVGRIAGAILAESEGQYFLVGNTKEPCDFAAMGFEPPVEIDVLKRPYLRLSIAGRVRFQAPWIDLDIEGEALARFLAERFLVERNGSVSERLWRLVIDPDGGPEGRGQPDGMEGIPARWLGEVPSAVWKIVRDTVLRCT